MSLLGETLLAKTVDDSKASLDISSLPAGVYLLKTGSQGKRFIKY
jgi:hypothetical protein